MSAPLVSAPRRSPAVGMSVATSGRAWTGPAQPRLARLARMLEEFGAAAATPRGVAPGRAAVPR